MAVPIINLSQVDSDYDYAYMSLEFYWPSQYYGSMPFDLYLDDIIYSGENHTITEQIYPLPRAGQFTAWNKRWDNGDTFYNTTRRIIPWNSTMSPYGNVNQSNGARAWLATNLSGNSDETSKGRSRVKDVVKIYIGRSATARQNSKVVSVKNLTYNGAWDSKYCGSAVTTLTTKLIPLPPTPTIEVSYHNYVDDSPTIVRLTAKITSNETGMFTLRLEDVTSTVKTIKETKGATSITHDIAVNESYYDKNWSYRARVHGPDVDKVSTVAKVYVEYPLLPIWYYETSTIKKQVKKGYYYDDNGNRQRIKIPWYCNGGVFQK